MRQTLCRPAECNLRLQGYPLGTVRSTRTRKVGRAANGIIRTFGLSHGPMTEFAQSTSFMTVPSDGYPPAPVAQRATAQQQVSEISALLNSLDEAAAESGQSLAEKRASAHESTL